MGRLVSVDLSGGGGRAVFLRKTGKVYIFEKAVDEVPSRDSLGGELLISSYHPDLIMERVEVPPVKDPETLEVLIKKRLSESAGLQGDYLLVYKLLEAQRDRRVYRIFGMPRDVYEESPLINEDTELKISIFTSSHLSLAGISKAVSEDLTLFHVYADKERIIMTVSRGDEVLYTRSVLFGGADPDSFLFEHVNMTYVFVAQRQNIPVDLILLSGLAKDMDSFIRDLINTVPAGVATPLVPENLRNVTPERMHSYLIPFGSLFLSSDYDFSPREKREKRWFFRTLNRSLMIIYPVLIPLLAFLAMNVYEFWINLKDYTDQREFLVTRSRAFFAEDLVREGKLDYFLTYTDLIYRSRVENPMNILKDVGPLFKILKAESYLFGADRGKLYLVINIDRTFRSLAEMMTFRENLFSLLEDLKAKKGISYRVERENRDLEANRLLLRIRLERKV